MYPKINNVIFVITNILEIVGILSCLIIYSFIVAFSPNNIITLQVVTPVVIIFIFTGIVYFKLSNYYPIEEKRLIFSVLEIAVVIFSFSIILLFSFWGSLVKFVSIINIAFYLILLCEVSIYFANKCRIMKK